MMTAGEPEHLIPVRSHPILTARLVGAAVKEEKGMKAISLWQPWASLWCSPAKVHETRHWPTSHRGWLLVHAAKRKLDDSYDRLDPIMDEHFGHHWGLEIPFGAIVGMVNVVGCESTDTMPIGHQQTDDYECGDFSAGRFAWRRAAFKMFAKPIPYRGSQGFFAVPNDLVPESAGADPPA